jgi:hypothetical protein
MFTPIGRRDSDQLTLDEITIPGNARVSTINSVLDPEVDPYPSSDVRLTLARRWWMLSFVGGRGQVSGSHPGQAPRARLAELIFESAPSEESVQECKERLGRIVVEQSAYYSNCRL